MPEQRDFSVTVHAMAPHGFQADLMWEGEKSPFARICTHEVEPNKQDATLFVVSEEISASPEEMTHIVEQMARIMQSNLSTELSACTIFQRIEAPDPPIPPEARQMHISRSGELDVTHRLIIRSLADADFAAQRTDNELYRNVAIAECILNSSPPQVTIIMQDESLMTEPESEGLARWLARLLKWPSDTTIDILRGKFVVQFEADSES